MTKERLLHVELESETDVYDFDKHNASPAILQPERVLTSTEFRSPMSKKCMKQMLADPVIEVSHSGITSTPCPVTGHQKTRKKIPGPGTPVPWVALSRLQQSSLASYAVSPIAVEHTSPNDLSRQVDVNSMFDSTSSEMDDSAVCISKSKSGVVGTATKNKTSSASLDVVPSGAECVVEEISGNAASQDHNTDKHKSEIDSGYSRFDSQCEFVSLLSGDDIGTRSKTTADDKKIRLPAMQSISSSDDNGHIMHAKKQAGVEDTRSVKTATAVKNSSSENDCVMVLYKPGTLDPKKFNSSRERKLKSTKRRRNRLYDDVEPSDESVDSDADAQPDVGSKSSDREKQSEPVKGATAVCHKACTVRITRNTALDSNSAGNHPSSKTDSRKAEKVSEPAVMSCDNVQRVKQPDNNTVDVENAGVVEKTKSRRRPNKVQCAESSSVKRKVLVQAGITEEAGANGNDAENDAAECKYHFSHLTN